MPDSMTDPVPREPPSLGGAIFLRGIVVVACWILRNRLQRWQVPEPSLILGCDAILVATSFWLGLPAIADARRRSVPVPRWRYFNVMLGAALCAFGYDVYTLILH